MLVLGIVIGLVAAGVAGAILFATGVIDLGDDGGADTREIEMPEELDGLAPLADIMREREQSDAAARDERTQDATAEALRDAYGGAAAAVQAYGSEDLERMVTILVVRAESPELLPPMVVAPEDMGLEVPINEVESIGNVECLIRNPPTAEGGEVDPEQVVIEVCQRTDSDLTVRAFERTGEMTAAELADFVDAAWEDIG
jgi:hypothetical protein